jgi:hypothetical protein
MSESTEKATKEAIQYETELSAQKEWDGSALEQARVFENIKKFAAQGSEGYSTPPLCSGDAYLITSI